MKNDVRYLDLLRRNGPRSSDYFCTGSQSSELTHLSRDIGNATLLLLSTPKYANFRISSIGAWLVPALRSGQTRFFFDQRGRPVGYVSWAYLTAQTELRWIEDDKMVIHPSEWNDGDRLWIIDLISPFGHGLSMMKFIRDELFLDDSGFSWAHRDNKGNLRSVLTFDLTTKRAISRLRIPNS